jgi:hypothetical protein
MNSEALIATATTMVADGKGLLAMDESTHTCNKRFEQVGIPQTDEVRRCYRELILTTPGLGESISGVILYDETIRQSRKDGTPLIKVITDAGIIPGIKVDTGAQDMAAHAGEKITEGLDGLRERLAEYSRMGARFAKFDVCRWRWHSQPSLHPGTRPGVGSLRRVVPGGRCGPGRRAGSAYGRRARSGTLPGGNRGSPANSLQPALLTTGDAGKHDPEAQHRASGIELPEARSGGRGR